MERAIQSELAKRFLTTISDVKFDGRKWSVVIRYMKSNPNYSNTYEEITHEVPDELIIRIRRSLASGLH